jgi:ribosomal protein L28
MSKICQITGKKAMVGNNDRIQNVVLKEHLM